MMGRKEVENNTMENETLGFRDLSIRARVAYGAKCLEDTRSHLMIANELLDEVLAVIWEFTESLRLDDWDDEIRELWSCWCQTPDEFVDDIPIERHQQVKELYFSLPQFVVEMVDNVIHIGEAELFGGIRGFSSNTLEYLLEVIRLMKENSILLPDITPFLASHISEGHGWGIPHNRSFYITES